MFGEIICFRKPHKTHRVVTDVKGAANQAAFAADADFSSNVEESPLTDVTAPPQQDPARSKVCSEQFKLPEGWNFENLSSTDAIGFIFRIFGIDESSQARVFPMA